MSDTTTLGDPDVLRRAVALGVNHIDASRVYGPDVVNELIAKALHPYRTTSSSPPRSAAPATTRGGWIAATRPEELRATVEADLRLRAPTATACF